MDSSVEIEYLVEEFSILLEFFFEEILNPHLQSEIDILMAQVTLVQAFEGAIIDIT